MSTLDGWVRASRSWGIKELSSDNKLGGTCWSDIQILMQTVIKGSDVLVVSDKTTRAPAGSRGKKMFGRVEESAAYRDVDEELWRGSRRIEFRDMALYISVFRVELPERHLQCYRCGASPSRIFPGNKFRQLSEKNVSEHRTVSSMALFHKCVKYCCNA